MSCRSIGIVQLSSSKFAVVEKSHKRTLVPSRPVINRQFGSEVMASCRVDRYRGKWGEHEGSGFEPLPIWHLANCSVDIGI